MAALPPVVHIPADERGSGTPAHHVGTVLRMLLGELAGTQHGAATAVDRLLDVLLVQILRAWLDRPEAVTKTSWLTGLRDSVTTAALTRLHTEPARPWTSDSLARAAGVSRATLTRRFRDAVGQAPLTYLTRWRMDLAAQALRDTDRPVDVIGRDVGYTSEYAFNRAFSRAYGTPPGRYRSAVRIRAQFQPPPQRAARGRVPALPATPHPPTPADLTPAPGPYQQKDHPGTGDPAQPQRHAPIPHLAVRDKTVNPKQTGRDQNPLTDRG